MMVGQRSKTLVLCMFAGLQSVAIAQFAGPPVIGSAPSAASNATALTPVYESIRLRPGDLIAVQVYGAPELTSSSGVRIGTKGEVNLPYLGDVVLSELTSSQAAQALAKRLKDEGILVDPQVSVQILDSPSLQIAVVGEVRSPKQVSALGQYHLMDVIAACGGLTDQASHVLTVQRKGQNEPIVVDLSTDPKAVDPSNIALLPGDTVIVPRVGTAYITGRVMRPQAIPLAGNQPITALRAITISGGTQFGAALSRARVIRTNQNGSKTEIVFDVKKIINGEMADITLHPDDVIVVPTNAFKAALAGGAASVGASALYGAAYVAK